MLCIVIVSGIPINKLTSEHFSGHVVVQAQSGCYTREVPPFVNLVTVGSHFVKGFLWHSGLANNLSSQDVRRQFPKSGAPPRQSVKTKRRFPKISKISKNTSRQSLHSYLHNYPYNPTTPTPTTYIPTPDPAKEGLTRKLFADQRGPGRACPQSC